MRRVVPILLVAILTSSAAASEGDPILSRTARKLSTARSSLRSKRPRR